MAHAIAPGSSGAMCAPDSDGKDIDIGEMEWHEDRGSDATIMIEGKCYFPPDSVKKDSLRPSSTTTRSPWKGTASSYSFKVNGTTNKDTA